MRIGHRVYPHPVPPQQKKLVADSSLSLCNDKDMLTFDKICLALWDNYGYLPDPVTHAFREAVVETAIQICHETGDEESYIKFCVETIRDWMNNDMPKNDV